MFVNHSASGSNTGANWANAFNSLQTAMEEENSHFEIERSFDGITYVQIGHGEGKDSTFSKSNYQFIDDRLETLNSKLKTPFHFGQILIMALSFIYQK